MNNTINDFDAAKAVTEQLKDMEKDRQVKILRWVSESLGIQTIDGVQQGKKVEVFENAPSLTAPARPSDIKSFIEMKQPGSDVQFATAVAYFYKFEARDDQKKDAIDTTSLQDAARLSGRSRILNPKNALNNAKYQGYLDAVERGTFRINTVGENLVAMALPGGPVVRPVGKLKSKSRSRVNEKKKISR